MASLPPCPIASQSAPARGGPAKDLAAANRRFYDRLWSQAHLESPERFNTWPFVSQLLRSVPARLEVGPGLRPRLPIAGTHFVDLSPAVIERLGAHGGIAIRAGADSLPFAEESFDLVCACDVIEHVADDRRVFHELSRVLKDNGTLMLSIPLHSHLWTEFDDWVGHARRYDLGELVALLAENGMTVQQSAIFGMKPQSLRLIRFAMRWLERRPREAMFWYNWLAMPLSLRLQKKLKLEKGILEPTGVDEMLLICRRKARAVPG